jgi:hypothetical protein
MRAAWILALTGCGFGAPAAPQTIDDTVDAGFTVAQCPASYDVMGAASRYRLITTPGTVFAHGDACLADRAGSTHLAVIMNLTLPRNTVWLGGVQAADANATDAGWIGLDGEPLIVAWGGQEPNDGGGTESDHREQFLRMSTDRAYLGDAAKTDQNGALCECDGQAISQAARALIEQYR